MLHVLCISLHNERAEKVNIFLFPNEDKLNKATCNS